MPLSTTIRIRQGAGCILRCRLTQDGEPVDLADCENIYFALRTKREIGGQLLFSATLADFITITDEEDGRFEITIEPAYSRKIRQSGEGDCDVDMGGPDRIAFWSGAMVLTPTVHAS